MNGLEKKHGGALQCEVLDATTPENKAQIREYGFGTHGLVIFDAEDNLKKKLDGHLMREPEINQALEEVLGSI